MKNKKYHTVGNSNREIRERGNIDTPNIQTHERPLSCLGTNTSIQNVCVWCWWRGGGGGGGGKLVVWTQTSPLSEMKVKLSHILWRTAFHML